MIEGHTDMPQGGVWARLPQKLRAYAELARLDRPIGIWLLLFPCWWGAALGGENRPVIYLLFAAGAIVMRGAGCTLNDMIDRRIDAEVERTRGRPLASGRVSLREAGLFLSGELALGFVILMQFPPRTIALGIVSLAIVALYPFMKRITSWPQAVLGLAFNWGALLGFITTAGHLSGAAWSLYGAGIAWTLGYDTIYAHQDKRDDARIGVRSTARRFGDGKGAVLLFYILFFALLVLAGRLEHLSGKFYAVIAVAAIFAGFELARWRPNDPADCLRRFKASRWQGLLVFAALICGRFNA
jgi:4-hydroxybenzoate polyprenyltransferase